MRKGLAGVALNARMYAEAGHSIAVSVTQGAVTPEDASLATSLKLT